MFAGVPLVVAVEAAERLDEVAEMAIDELNQGHLIAIPTETVYGLAADALRPDAVQRLYAVKGRNRNKPIAWFVRDLEDIEKAGAEVSPILTALAQAFWPGPLTVVVRCGAGTRGFRIPDHRLALRILEKIGRPLAVTSANLSGRPPARRPDEVIAEVGEHVAVVFTDPPQCQALPSTVVDITDGDLRVLREGAISLERLRQACGK